MSKKKYPQTMYVYEETHGNEKFWLCTPNFEECANMNEKAIVGIYKLEEMACVKNKSTFE